MKAINKILWLAALPLAFTACQDEDIAGNNPTTQNKDMYTLHCVMEDGIQSRAYVRPGGTDVENEFAVWSYGDNFVLYDHADITDTDSIAEPVSSIFNITEYDGLSAEADFVSNRALTDGNTVTAIYPVQTGAINKGNITLQMTNYAHDVLRYGRYDWEWETYMRQNMFMYATATVKGITTTLNFKHLTALARITYTNMTDKDQQISSCILSGNGNYFGEKIEMNVKTGTIAAKPFVTTLAGIHFENLTVAPNESRDIYMLFFPGEDFTENGTLTFSVDTLTTAPMATADILANNSGAKGFEAGKRYWFQVAQTDEGLIWVKDMPKQLITNKELIAAIEKNQNISFIKNEDGSVNVYQNYDLINKISSIYIDNDTISTLEGIEYLPNLEKITCYSSELSSLDVSKNVKLKYLRCFGGKLTQLDVTQNTALIELCINDNLLTTIDVTNNTALEGLYCKNNQLASLNVTNNTALEILDCDKNTITSLDLSANTALREIDCQGNQLSNLNVANNTALEGLYCGNNQLSSLNVTNNMALEILYCFANNLTSLDLSANTALREIHCEGNQLSNLNVANNTALEILYCAINQLSSLNVTNNTALESLYCYNNPITSLDLSANTALREIDCEGNQLSNLNVANNTALETLYCNGNNLTSLDLSANKALVSLVCQDNRITALDLIANTALDYLLCGSQKDEIILVLTLNQTQQEKWTTSWKDNNWNVVLSNASSTNSGADFTSGGVY